MERRWAVAVARDSSRPEADWRLWLLSTNVHRTHNKDHDIGSLFLNVGGLTWIGEEPGRRAAAHSTIALVDPDLVRAVNIIDFSDPSEALMFGGRLGDRNLPRDHSGAIACQHLGGMTVVSAVAEYGLFKLGDKRNGVIDYRVDVCAIEDEPSEPGAFLVLRQAITAPGTLPCHTMVFPRLKPTISISHRYGRQLVFEGMGSAGFYTAMDAADVSMVFGPLAGNLPGVRVIETYSSVPELLQTVQLVQIGDERWHLDLDCGGGRLAMIHLSGPNGKAIKLAPGMRGRRRGFSAPRIIKVNGSDSSGAIGHTGE